MQPPQTESADALRDLLTAERATSQLLRQTVHQQAQAIASLERLLVEAETLASRYRLGVYLRDA